MTGLLVCIDRSTIRDGSVEELKKAVRRLVEFIDAHVPGIIAYSVHLDEEERKMTVVQVHPDSASLEFHMEVGREEFRKFKNMIDLYAIEIYGQPSDRLRELLSEKARMLGKGTLEVHPRVSGFARMPG